MLTPRQLQAAYQQGQNISALMRDAYGITHNTGDIIETSYDLQTGSYIKALDDPAMATHQRDYTVEIAGVIRNLCAPTSILEAGVGEATTLSGVLQQLALKDGDAIDGYGFDLSWSRTAYAKQWLAQQGVANATLFTGDLFHIPVLDNAIDVVYTSHSIEPNGGQEAPILKELYRITRQYLVLLEPGYELAPPKAQQRMEQHGYCKNLAGIAKDLGYNVCRHELFSVTATPLNPTAITVIQKSPATEIPVDSPLARLACPQFKTPLQAMGNALYSPEALVAYPVLEGIPCLRRDNGILASKYPEVSAPA